MKTWYDLGIQIDGAKGSGAERKTTCPQCSPSRKKSKYPCLNINLDKGVWHCWHCEWSGSLQKGEEQKSSPPRYKAYRKPDAPQPVNKPGLQEWFQRREIPLDVWQRRGVSLTRVYFPQIEDEAEAIAFPYYRDGELVNVKYRMLEEKYFRMAPGAERILYGLDEIQGNTVVWCEGELDALALEAAGIRSVISVPDGAPAPDTKNYESKFDYLSSAELLLSGITQHILAVDNDAPGQALARELARRLGPEKCYQVIWSSECKDANDVLMSYGPETLKECIDRAQAWPVEGIIRPLDLREAFKGLYRQRTVRGFSTGWPSLDAFYTVKPGEWTLITGIPSHGKSSLLSALAIQLAQSSGWRFAICPPEQQPLEQYAAYLCQMSTGFPFFDGPQMRMTLDEAMQALEWLDGRVSFLLPAEHSPNLTEILELSRVEVFRRGIQGLIIDPYNELDHSRPGNLTETEYVSQFISQIRLFARRHRVHVWVVAHPTKLYKGNDGNYPIPTAYDVSGSAHWYNKADNILTIYRDVKADDNRVQIHVQKVRFRQTGKPGVVELFYQQATGKFFDRRTYDASGIF